MKSINQLPSIYGRYILLNKFAIGGMAEVFRAKSFGAEDFEKLIAIKRLYPHLSEDPSFVQMFINEAKLAATLNHVNVTPIYDFGCQQGFYYIAMEYVRGCDLADLIARCRHRQQQIPLGLAIWLLIEICNGLDYAHRKHDDLGRFLNLIHRDVTPQNILISFEGEVKITDFGIAKVQMLERSETTGGLLKGKFSYMSPEQVRGDRLDHRSDIFSLGIVAWELLTSQKMFDGPNDYHILEQVREAMYIPARQLNPHLPPDVEQIITKALTRYPEDRYQSVGQLRLDLLRFLSTSGLFPSRAHLSSFVRKLFDDKLQRETREIAEETRIARKVWSHFRDEIEVAAQERRTLTISPEALAQAGRDVPAPSPAKQELPQGPPGWSPPMESPAQSGAFIPHQPPSPSRANPLPSLQHQGLRPDQERGTESGVFIPHPSIPPPQGTPLPHGYSGDFRQFGGVQGQSGESIPMPPLSQASVYDTIGMHVPAGYEEEDDATLPDVNTTPPPPRHLPTGLQPPAFPHAFAAETGRDPRLFAPSPGGIPRPTHVPHPKQGEHGAHDPFDHEEEEHAIHRFGHRKNLSLIVGLSTFVIGVVLVLLLAHWFFPQPQRSTRPTKDPGVQKLSPITPGTRRD